MPRLRTAPRSSTARWSDPSTLARSPASSRASTVTIAPSGAPAAGTSRCSFPRRPPRRAPRRWPRRLERRDGGRRGLLPREARPATAGRPPTVAAAVLATCHLPQRRGLGAAVDQVRRSENRTLRQHGDDRLVKTRYLWLTRRGNMTQRQRRRFTPLRKPGAVHTAGPLTTATETWILVSSERELHTMLPTRTMTENALATVRVEDLPRPVYLACKIDGLLFDLAATEEEYAAALGIVPHLHTTNEWEAARQSAARSTHQQSAQEPEQ